MKNIYTGFGVGFFCFVLFLCAVSFPSTLNVFQWIRIILQPVSLHSSPEAPSVEFIVGKFC